MFQNSTVNALTTVVNVTLFGLGMATPLVVLATVTERYAQKIISFLTSHKRSINVGTGVALILVALYYLIIDFNVIPV